MMSTIMGAAELARVARTSRTTHDLMLFSLAISANGQGHSAEFAAMADENSPPVATLLAGSDVLTVGRDPWSGHFVLSNLVSREHIAYDGYESMFLQHGEDGDSVLVCVRPGDVQHENLEFKYPDDELQYSAYSDGQGRNLLVNRVDMEPVYVAQLQKRLSLATLSLRCGARRQECKLQIGIFEFPGFCDTHMRFNLHEVYDVLARASHQHRWTWVSRNWSSWAVNCNELLPFAEDGLMKSLGTAADLEADTKHDSPLLWPSCSSYMLVALLSRFGLSAAPQAGRLRDEESVRASQEILEAIALKLLLHSRAELKWPGTPMGENPVELDIDEDARVNIGTAWRQLPHPQDQCIKFFEDMVLAQGSSVSLVDLLAQVVTWRPRSIKARHVLLGQLIIRIAIEFERVVGEVIDSAAQNEFVSASRQEFQVGKCSSREMSRHLVCVVNAQRKFFSTPPVYLSIASDKSRVLGTTLLSSCLVTPQNKATWCFPIVRRLVVPGGGRVRLLCKKEEQWWIRGECDV